MEAVSIASSAMQLHLLGGGPFSPETAKANDDREMVVGLFYGVVFLATVIGFGRWIVAAHKFVRSRGAHGLSVTPGWAVGWFFIPLFNLVRPYTAMKELWQASQDPRSHFVQDVSPVLPTWWALWILNGIIGQISIRLKLNAEGIEALKTATVIDIVSATAGIALGLAALKLVRGIDTHFARLDEPPPIPKSPDPLAAAR